MLVFFTLQALGQATSQEGRYSVDFNRGCAPLTINVTEHDGFGDIARQYYYFEGADPTNSKTHTYTTAGVYTLVQLVGINVDPKTDTLIIEVLEPLVPKFDYIKCDNRQVQVTIDDQNYPDYEVTFAGSSSVTLKDQESSVYSFSHDDPLSIDVRGIHVNAADNCPETSIILPEVIDNLDAPSVQSAGILQYCEDSFGLTLTSSPDEDVRYEIELNRSNGLYQTIWQGEFMSDLTLTEIVFSAIESSFCVRVVANNVCDGSRIIGESFCQNIDEGALDPVRNLYSTYQGNDVLISLDEAAGGEFLFERSFNQSTFSKLSESTGNYRDEKAFLGRQYFYKVSFLDSCDGNWGLKQTSPPFINAAETQKNRFDVSFSPAVHQLDETFSYQGILTGNGGSETIDFSGNSFQFGLSPELGETQTLIVTGLSDNFSVQSNSLTFEFEFIVHVPKAFTPNGDGLNDRLEFFGLGEAQGELKIYTRWGQQIYGEISSAPSWDGRINGKKADEGVYIYEISIPQMANHIQKGTFALIKN